MYQCSGNGGGGGLLSLNYMLVHKHMGRSVRINTLTSTVAALGWTLGALKGFSASSLTNKIHSVSISEI